MEDSVPFLKLKKNFFTHIVFLCICIVFVGRGFVLVNTNKSSFLIFDQRIYMHAVQHMLFILT